MQKRVRKNSDYICPKKPKLDIAVNNDQEKTEANSVPSQYVHSKENDTESESLLQGIPSAECSEYNNLNVTNNKSPVGNSTMKTFVKSETSENESAEFKETFQKTIKCDEGEENTQITSDIVSSSPGNNVYSGNMLSQENSEGKHDPNPNAKQENESMDSLSNYKLLHRENDILIDFETSTAAIESSSIHTMSDGNTVCIPTEKEVVTSDTVSMKDSIIIKKSLDSTNLTIKSIDESNPSKLNPNLGSNNPSQLNALNAEAIASIEKKKLVAGHTTAKVSIGNTTLSVPLLKDIIANDGKSVPNIVRKVINIRGKKIRAPTIVQLSQLQLNNKTNTKIVQATLVGNKIQLPNMGFKSSQSFIKSNMVQPSPIAVTTLPKQIFEDEPVIVEKPNQVQGQSTEECDLKSIENSAVSNINNKTLAKPKETHTKPQVHEELVPKSSAPYLTQLCVIDADKNTHTKSFENPLADSLPTSITVTSSAENALPKVSATVAKSLRKPIMFNKTAGTSEVMSGATAKDLCEVLNANMPKESQQLPDNISFSKKLEDNSLLRKQIALAVQNNRLHLKVSKVMDDNKMKRAEKITEFVGISNAKRQMTKLNPIINQTGSSDTVLVTNIDKVEKPNNNKSEETQNVLLKHLLQSSINQRSNTSCSQNMAPRKLATVRAPSLGVVSSLEAQLARPVIPPVSSVGEIKSELKLHNKIANDKLKKPPMDRENLNIKSRPEIISRETSFVSTFSPRQKMSTNSLETEKLSSIQTNTSLASDADNNKIIHLQTSISTSASASTSQSTSTNSNYNAINLFKLFRQNDENKSQPNTSPIQNKLRSPDENCDNLQLTIKKEYDNTGYDGLSSSPTVKTKLSKLDIEQNIEMRKKFKRDYQKHKRQLLLNKEPQGHQKKKSRKLSKASEDFDEFIENKVVQMKQMFVLEVLEPLLSTFLGICSVYGYNDRVRNQVEHAYQNAFKEDFGRTNLKNLVDYYSVKPYGPNQNAKVNNVPTFQNKFYDEEFSSMNNESCDKLYNFITTLKQQSLQPAEHFSLVPSSPRSSSSSSNSYYPGVKFSKHFSINTDRLSPVIPYMNSNNFGAVTRKKPTHLKRNKCVYGNVETTVNMSLSSFVAKNILDILRDLDHLLHVYSPVSYKLLNNDRVNARNIKSLYISRVKNLQRTQSTNIQNFLNGTYKCCRNCHMIIICGIVGAESNSGIKKKIMNENHFCDKYCCIQYKKKGKKYVLSRKRERCIQNSKPAKQIIANENNCCNNSSYKIVGPNSFWKPSYKGATSEDANEICLKMRIAITLNTSKDTRRCILCNQKGDAFADGSSRLLNYDVNKWVHLNCALWSNSVYETINGGLMNLELTMQHGLHQICSFCNQYGASIKCFKMRCGHIYHLPCAIKEHCVFYKNKTIHCASHAHRMDKKNELNSIRVRRRVYIERDENRQVAAVMHHLELSNLLRIGNLTFINVGQLLPHQLEAFHTPNYIYPIGYKIVRFFWSTRKVNKRCRYICSITEANGRPEFVIQIQEPFESDVELRDETPKAVWQKVLEKIVALRKGQGLVQLFTEFFTGEDLFGLSEPSIVRILESLPGVESLTDYRFKYGRNPLLELPLAINPSGSARTEPKQRHIINWKKAHTQRTSSINLKLSLSPSSLVAGEVACPYSKQFVHSKSSQYRKMKQEWRNNVYLARSKIQGLGLYAARDLEKHTMVIEYIGQVIRTEVSELREKQYDLRNRGIYMFRLDEERVVDATLSGGLARYINHSCNPNCVTEIVDVDREYRIIIFAKRRINKGEELSYDYKFDIEDDAHKISCMCDAPNCRKWMN